MYDIIGDIHGHASVLKRLLNKMGYENSNGSYSHPDRKALFLGDYIDRGPDSPAVLDIVRSMVKAGNAIALMGNHEFNAIIFNEPDGSGGYIRDRSFKNITQHCRTMSQFKGDQESYTSYIDWFKTLPLFFENEDFRAVHASWNGHYINELKEHNVNANLSHGALREAGKKGTRLYEIVEELLKGKEVPLPNDLTFQDKGGHERSDARVKWWLDPKDIPMKKWSINEVPDLDESIPVDSEHHSNYWYSQKEKPVFFGHYWLSGKVEFQKPNVCCLDYSIGKKEKLVAYRYKGEKQLTNDNIEKVKF